MKYDVILSCTLPTGLRASGYLTAEPMEASKADIEELVLAIQKCLNEAEFLVMFTRDKKPITETPADCELSPSEICLPGDLVKKSLLITQIIGVPDEAAE